MLELHSLRGTSTPPSIITRTPFTALVWGRNYEHKLSKMPSNDSKAGLKLAIVLTWDGSTTRILCPYKCPKRIHTHGTTMPSDGDRNSRLAHCGHDPDEPTKQYRLVYPFQEGEEAADGLWWILDTEKRRWRTIGYNVYDPEYEEPEVESVSEPPRRDESSDTEEAKPESEPYDETSDEERERLVQEFKRLDLHEGENELEKVVREEREAFVSACVLNEQESVKAILERSPDPARLIGAKCPSTGKTVLHMVCEEGHMHLMNLLLEHNASLEAKDDLGDTPLLRATVYGNADIVSRLIEAGADTETIDESGATFISRVRTALSPQEEHRKYYQRILDLAALGTAPDPLQPREMHEVYDSNGQVVMENFVDPGPLYRPDENGIARAKTSLKIIDERLERLRSIIQRCEIEEANAQWKTLLRKIAENHGEEQARHLAWFKKFDLEGMTASIMGKTITTPISTSWKTVACLTRGVALPLTFAVSGWTSGNYGTADGALDRTLWVDQVFKLAKIVGYEIPKHPRNDERRGSFFACHSEKQLLAFLISQHTTAFLDHDHRRLGHEIERRKRRLDDKDLNEEYDNLKKSLVALQKAESEHENLKAILTALQQTKWVDGQSDVQDYWLSSLRKLKVNIFVCQPGRNQAWICDDCIEFCGKVAKEFGLRLNLRAVMQSDECPSNEVVVSWP